MVDSVVGDSVVGRVVVDSVVGDFGGRPGCG